MIEAKYLEHFIKDLSNLKSIPSSYSKIKKLCFEEIPELESFRNIRGMKKIEGEKIYFRIRSGDYRIGIKFENGIVSFMRVLHRREIYRYFP